MTQAKGSTARVAHVLDLSETTRLVELEPEASLDFAGGQYIYVDSGIALPDGKTAKGSYSFVSADARQERLVLAVKRIGSVSKWLHERSVGDEVSFSGPWGRFTADDAPPRRTLVLATDTGITAALGLIRGRAFAPQLATVALMWLVESERYFLPDAFVRAALPAGVAYRQERVPAVGHADRPSAAVNWARALVAEAGAFERVFLVGDGAAIYPVRDALGVGEAKLESFFNTPKKPA